MQSNQPELRADHYVIVRIWTSQNNKQLQGHDVVGHVSLEIQQSGLDGLQQDYISFWPGSGFTDEERAAYQSANLIKQQELYYYAERTGEFIESVQEDIQLEGHPPEFTAYLYSLSLENLVQASFKLRGDAELVPNFRLIGSGFSLFTDCNSHSSHNCSSLTYQLLMAGGIYNQHLGSSQRSNHSLYTNPDKLFELVKRFKDKEVAAYPETKELDDENGAEYAYAEPSRGCSMM